MGPGGFGRPWGHRYRWGLNQLEHVDGTDAAAPMGRQHLRHGRLSQARRASRRGSHLQELPAPGLISGRTQLEPRGIKPVPRLPPLVRGAAALGEQRFFRPAEFSSHQEGRFLHVYLAQAGPVCTSGIR
jgi:hypothetical protein